MQFEIKTPTRAYFGVGSIEEFTNLQRELTYTNTSAAHDVKRHYNNKWLRRKDSDAWERRLEVLKAKVKNTLVFNDESGQTYIRPSSLQYLQNIPFEVISNKIKYPTPKKVAWAHKLPFELHPYQKISIEKLLEIRHGNVELCTGAGKSAILLNLCRETGFRTAIVAPSQSIFLELVTAFEYYIGRGLVGTFGDGKKKIGKLFTICIADSLTNIEKGSEEWDFFSKVDMLCVDESHTWGADTLEELCHGIFENVPYRFFMSGTQTRGDGAEMLLQSIIGRTVYTLTTEEAIKGGYICPLDFGIVNIESSNPNYNSTEPLEMKRIHFLRNRNIAAFAAKLANATGASGQQVLVLVEELSQITMLSKMLKVPFAYAHSEKNKAKLLELGLDKVDNKEAVEKFNKNEVKVLIGTSCIATGTNIYPMRHTVNWVGGASEIRTKQGPMGRSVRLGKQNPYKEKCAEKSIVTVWDFNVSDIETMRRHLDERLAFYRESGGTVKRINFDAQKVQTGGVR